MSDLPRNVLFLMADELAWWGLGQNNPAVRTPNLDRLAARGLRFDAAYTPSPICVPARAAFATGRYVHEIGYWSSAEPYDGRVKGWAHLLNAAGIRADSIGKLHYRRAGDDTGFASEINALHVPDNGRGWVRGLLRQPLCDYDATAELAEMIGPGNSDYLDYDRLVADEAMRWIGARGKAPWCGFVSFLTPHYPLIAPPDFYALYDPEALASEAEAVPDHPIIREIAGFFSHDQHFSRETRGIARAAYFGLCSFLDAQVGLVLDALETSGRADDTLIIFTSDHGEMLGEKGMWTKSCMYESAARVPLILAGPGVAPGHCTAPVSLIDIAPTICNALGVAHEFTGCDLQSEIPADRMVLSEYHDGGASVGVTMLRWQDADGDWKLVHYAEGFPSQLFELGSDPGEVRDLATARPDALEHGRHRLFAMLDPEEVNRRAHADQAQRIEELGGRVALLAAPQWNFTPTDSD